jgi:hypothetical protein
MTMAKTATIAMIATVFSVIVLFFCGLDLPFVKFISAVTNTMIAVTSSIIVFIVFPIYINIMCLFHLSQWLSNRLLVLAFVKFYSTPLNRCQVFNKPKSLNFFLIYWSEDHLNSERLYLHASESFTKGIYL